MKAPSGCWWCRGRTALTGHAVFCWLPDVYPLSSPKGSAGRFFVQSWGSNVFFPAVPQLWLCPSTLELTSTKPFCNEWKSWCSIPKTHRGVHTVICRACSVCHCCSQSSQPGSGLPLGMVVPPLPAYPCLCLRQCQTRELIWPRMTQGGFMPG